MTLVEATYEKLGLTPLDTFIQQQVALNSKKFSNSPDQRYRGIGATTWMLVSAVVRMSSSDVLIVAHDRVFQQELQRRTEDILRKLNYRLEWRRDGGLFSLGLPSSSPLAGHTAYFSTHKSGGGDVRVVGNVNLRGVPFEDALWKALAIRRSQGPFGMITEVRFLDGKYLAFAKNDEFILELSQSGALELLLENRDIAPIGWALPPKSKEWM